MGTGCTSPHGPATAGVGIIGHAGGQKEPGQGRALSAEAPRHAQTPRRCALRDTEWNGAPGAMESAASRAVVAQFWACMGRNDFEAAGALLHDEFVLDWPQSGERICGRANFVAINEHYPAAGPWRCVVQRLIAQDQTVVTDVRVTDGVQTGRAIAFSEVREGRIARQTEYWPDPFEAPAWRTPWTETAE